MRFLFCFLAALALLASPAFAGNKAPDLIVKSISASAGFGDTQLDVESATANKGKKAAKASRTGVYLSTDGKRDAADTKLGDLGIPRLKPKKSATRHGSFAIPQEVPDGNYKVIGCADDKDAVGERVETNQCKVASGSIVVTHDPPPPETISVSAAAGSGGSVAASGVSGGSCVAAACTLNSGASSVTFTPTPGGINTFKAWTGPSCTGYTTGPGNAITFTNPTATKACTATFNEFVTISWTNPLSWGAVSGCGNAASTAASGSCIAAKGSTTAISAHPSSASFTFDSWSGVTCDGTTSSSGSGLNQTNTMTFTNLASDHTCVVSYKFASG